MFSLKPTADTYIQGNKINLRFIKRSDARSIAEHADNPNISRFTFIPHPYGIDDARKFIAHTLLVRKEKSGYHLGMEDPATGRIIGMVGLEAFSKNHHRAEMGYWLSEQYWGRGITPEAITMMLDQAFGPLELVRVYAHVFPENTQSIRVLEKVGFVHEGLLRQHVRKADGYHDCHFFGILKNAWRRP